MNHNKCNNSIECKDWESKRFLGYCRGCIYHIDFIIPELVEPEMVKPEMEWSGIKKRGSDHYKKDPLKTEPIDLFKDGGMLRDFALSSIIKYAYRNRNQTNKSINVTDMEKIKHYCDMLMVIEK